MSLQPVILCGGHGFRLWPLSTPDMPKQFLKIFNGKCLFELTLERAYKINPEIMPIIVASENHEFLIKDILNRKKINAQILFEPVGRNTTISVYMAAKFADLNDTLIVMPSDHIIPDDNAFAELVNKICNNTVINFWMTFGVRPTFPSVAFGYVNVQIDHEMNSKILDVISFHEKPTQEKAIGMIKNGNYLWNSGIFMGNTNFVLKSIQRYSKSNTVKCDQILNEIRLHKKNEAIKFEINIFKTLNCKSIDYEIIEKEKRIKCAILDLQWSDVGSWDSAFDHISLKENRDKVLEIDGKNRILNLSDTSIATVGIKDLIIINTQNHILITKNGQSEKIRELVKMVEFEKQNFNTFFSTKRPWGGFDILFESELCKVKKLTLLPNKRISLQYHKRRSEHWYVVSGIAYVHLNGKEFKLEKGSSVDVKKGSHHYLANREKENLIVIEIQVGDYFGEDDIIRLDDPYGRI